jgi:hypothetical protein
LEIRRSARSCCPLHEQASSATNASRFLGALGVLVGLALATSPERTD